MSRVSSAIAAVPFLFGCLGSIRAPGPVIVQGLADLGIPPGATRTALHRMVARGQLARRREGRVTVYEMRGAFLRAWERIRHRDEPAGPTWSGGFDSIVYEIGEDQRWARDDLRTAAFAAGWAAVRPGFLVGVTSRTDDMDEAIESARTAGGLVLVGRFETDLATARELAAVAWELPRLAAELREAAAEVSATLAAIEGSAVAEEDRPLAAYRALAEVTIGSAQTQLGDPGLPPELLPRPWPAQEMVDARRRLYVTMYPLVSRYVETLVLRQSWPRGVPTPGSYGSEPPAKTWFTGVDPPAGPRWPPPAAGAPPEPPARSRRARREGSS